MPIGALGKVLTARAAFWSYHTSPAVCRAAARRLQRRAAYAAERLCRHPLRGGHARAGLGSRRFKIPAGRWFGLPPSSGASMPGLPAAWCGVPCVLRRVCRGVSLLRGGHHGFIHSFLLVGSLGSVSGRLVRLRVVAGLISRSLGARGGGIVRVTGSRGGVRARPGPAHRALGRGAAWPGHRRPGQLVARIGAGAGLVGQRGAASRPAAHLRWRRPARRRRVAAGARLCHSGGIGRSGSWGRWAAGASGVGARRPGFFVRDQRRSRRGLAPTPSRHGTGVA